jgi:sugar/nucleoside kinase (ribokinase family)
VPSLCVAGNLAIDLIDGAPPSPGGCPSFAARALRMLDREGQILTRYGEADSALFEPFLATLGMPLTVLPAEATTAFGFRYDGEQRTMTVDAIGQAWSAEDARSLAGSVGFVHVAPLLRSDFPPEALAALAADGRTLSYDGQGLVRVPEVGPMRVDRSFDPRVLDSISILKLAEDEASVVAGGEFSQADASALGVAEILVTRGSRGCTVYTRDGGEDVPAAWPVLGVQTTGAGDVFMVAYMAGRSEGAEPREAAARASEVVARMLEARRRPAAPAPASTREVSPGT